MLSRSYTKVKILIFRILLSAVARSGMQTNRTVVKNLIRVANSSKNNTRTTPEKSVKNVKLACLF